MTLHHPRVLAVAAVLIGISALVLMEACAGAPQTLDEQRALAEQGDVEMQVRLGGFYEFGNNGVPEDDVEAARWYHLAAETGDPMAQLSLGAMYAAGADIPQDDVEAHMRFSLAAQYSDGELRDTAVKDRDAVAERMTAEPIAEAQRRAQEWTPPR